MLTETMLQAQPPRRIALNGPTMGTRYSAVFYARTTPDGLPDALQRAVDTVDKQMSTWKPQSDLMRFNAAPVGEWTALPSELLYVLEVGLVIGQITGGAFDIGVLDLVSAWGFNDHSGKPNATLIEHAATTPRRPAHDLMELDRPGCRARKLAPLAIDLSGIAKGYGVDRLADAMGAFGVGDFIVSIDGEVRAKGRKPDGAIWRVALEAPEPGRRDVAGILDLDDAALATSGDYRHRVQLGSQSYSHTMDPRTGRPLANGIAAATVRAATCIQADAWATAMMVLGEAALPLANSLGIEALLTARN